MYIKALVTSIAVITCVNANASEMDSVFDDLNANVGNPTVLKTQTMNYYHGGNLTTNSPVKSYNLASASAPTVSAGCGGIDLHMGGFSFISKDQFVSLLRNIGSNALGYGFKIALQNICPTCENVMTSLQNTADKINQFNINSCQASKGIVNATANQIWDTQYDTKAMEWGSADGIFSDAVEAYREIKGAATGGKRASIAERAVANNPARKDEIPYGNVTWDALKSLGADQRTKRQIMGLVGTVILGTEDKPRYIPPSEELSVAKLLSTNRTVLMPMPTCDNNDYVDCMGVNMNAKENTKTFHTMVMDNMRKISRKISKREDYGSEKDDILSFISATELPIYKIVALGTSINDTATAENLMAQYSTLIAAKYAQSYVRMVTQNTRKALYAEEKKADSAAKVEAIEKLLNNLAQIETNLNADIATIYRSARGTMEIADQIRTLEATVASSLSTPIYSSLEYGNNLK